MTFCLGIKLEYGLVGIADTRVLSGTEMVVARNLSQEGLTRDGLGRDGFIEQVWQWKAHSGGTIERQMRRLGASGDWSRSAFTMDPMASQAVIEAFVRMHEQG